MSVNKHINGFVLKMVAVCSMLIDHTAATILERILRMCSVEQYTYVYTHINQMQTLYLIMRGIGRLAFPIYCFLIVEGFKYTRNVYKYAGRLFLFALLSEVPFDLAFQKSVWDMSYNNVFFTLFLGLLAITGISEINKRLQLGDKEQWRYYVKLFARSLLDVMVIFTCMFVADTVLHTDYGASGVIAIVVIYILRRHPCVAMIVATVLLSLMSSGLEILALPVVLLLYMYNGKRGKQCKYFFYAFYPVHLLILSFICYLLGLGI